MNRHHCDYVSSLLFPWYEPVQVNSIGRLNHFLSQVQLSEKTSLLEKAEAKGEELTAKVNEQQKLIQKLEDDILKVCKSV